MNIRFKYNYDVEFLLRINSRIVIEGTGQWEVNEEDIAYEFEIDPEENFIEFCKNYFWYQLDIDPDRIEFNLDDLKQLEKYCNNETDRN